jgi:hypothetical protein
MPVIVIDTEAVLKVLQPIWAKVPETASRLRGRIENMLDAAKARGFPDGAANPAQWRGHLKNLLPARQRQLPLGHCRSLSGQNCYAGTNMAIRWIPTTLLIFVALSFLPMPHVYISPSLTM